MSNRYNHPVCFTPVVLLRAKEASSKTWASFKKSTSSSACPRRGWMFFVGAWRNTFFWSNRGSPNNVRIWGSLSEVLFIRVHNCYISLWWISVNVKPIWWFEKPLIYTQRSDGVKTLRHCGRHTLIFVSQSLRIPLPKKHILVPPLPKKTHEQTGLPSWNMLGISLCMYPPHPNPHRCRISILCLRPMWFPQASKPVRQGCFREKYYFFVSKLTTQLPNPPDFFCFWRGKQSLISSRCQVVNFVLWVFILSCQDVMPCLTHPFAAGFGSEVSRCFRECGKLVDCVASVQISSILTA